MFGSRHQEITSAQVVTESLKRLTDLLVVYTGNGFVSNMLMCKNVNVNWCADSVFPTFAQILPSVCTPLHTLAHEQI